MTLAAVLASFLVGLPTMQTDTLAAASCIGTSPLHDLAQARLVCTRRWSIQAETVAVANVRGLEGQDDFELGFDDLGLIWTCVVAYRDTAGNESCPTNRVAVNLPPASVPPREPVSFYDIAGRKIAKPTLPGIYIERTGRARKLMVIR